MKIRLITSTLLLLLLASCGININESIVNTAVELTDGSEQGGTIETEEDETPLCETYASASNYNDIGDGTVSSPFLICTVEQFVNIGASTAAYSSHFKLMADIDLTDYTQTADGTQYIPIGNDTNSFVGTFNGNNKVISNFSYNDNTFDNLGLFGVVKSSAAKIKNLTLDTVAIVGGDNVGALAGKATFGAITSIKILSGNITGEDNVGGLIGLLGNSAVVGESSANATIGSSNNGSDIGGLIGAMSRGSMVFNSFATGDVINAGDWTTAGGLVGTLSNANITNSYATGNVSAGSSSSAGGLFGFQTNSTLNNLFATGNVTASNGGNNVGAIYGNTFGGGCSNCYYNSNATLTNNGAGGTQTSSSSGSYDLGASPNSFYSVANAPLSSWDFNDVWSENTNDFPSLSVSVLDENSWGDCLDHLSDTPFAGGIGVPSNPYLICTNDQFAMIDTGNYYQTPYSYVVMQDLDFGSYSWTPIGGDYDYFRGSFDGNGKTITDFTFNNASNNWVGLFAGIQHGHIKRLGLINPSIIGGGRTSGFAGRLHRASSVDLYIEGGSISGTTDVGGLFGEQREGTVYNSYTNTTVSGTNTIGGLAGDYTASGMNNCFSLGDVIAGGGATEAGQLTGFGTLSGIYYDTTSACTNCTNSTGTGIDTSVSTNYYFDATNSPMDTWDFVNTWSEGVAILPTLLN